MSSELTIQRLNMDSSWWLEWGKTSILIDPWLLGTEVDGFSWFNEQWHVTPPMPIESLQSYNAIVVSQPFSDHCHEETLAELNKVPIITTPKAVRRLKKTFPNRQYTVLGTLDTNTWTPYGEWQMTVLEDNNKLSAAFDGIVIKQGEDLVVYCPHGFSLTTKQLKALAPFQTRLLMTGFSTFRLPFFLGGTVNPGLTNAERLIQQLEPQKVVQTHDEQKHAKGIVTKIATTHYPTSGELAQQFQHQFVVLNSSYTPYVVDN